MGEKAYLYVLYVLTGVQAERGAKRGAQWSQRRGASRRGRRILRRRPQGRRRRALQGRRPSRRRCWAFHLRVNPTKKDEDCYVLVWVLVHLFAAASKWPLTACRIVECSQRNICKPCNGH